MVKSKQSTLCRGCKSKDLRLIHDFGTQPLAGSYPLEKEGVWQAKRYPLDLSECVDCGMWQVTNLPPIEEVFHSNYHYSSSTIPDLVRHFESYADFLAQRLPEKAKIFEFGCNDGILLEKLSDRGYTCIGVDASDNVAAMARLKGLEVHTGFLSPKFVREKNLQSSFDFVTCSNVLAHISDLDATISAVKLLLKKGGIFSIEVHDADALAEELQFDTIYHEHLTYFTQETLKSFTSRHGFDFVECQKTTMHGGGLRFMTQYSEKYPVNVYSSKYSGARINPDDFSAKILRCRADIIRLYELHGPIDGYGAAGRAQMFINMTNTAQYFRRIYDDSPLRQGRYIVGTNIPIVPYKGETGNCCVILAWNYAHTISSRIANTYKNIVTILPKMKNWEY